MRTIRLLVIFFLFPFSAFSQNNIEWITHFGSQSPYYGVELGRKIVTDSDGNIYVAGEFADVIKYGDIELTSNGNKEIFLVKLDSTGIIQWFKNFGGTEADWCGDICVDDNSNVYLTGIFREEITIGNSTFTSKGGFSGYDFFLTKLNGDGNILWSKAFMGDGGNATSSITIDKEGDLYIMGYYNDILSFDDYELTGPIGRSDLFVTKLNYNGDVIWAKSTKSNANNIGNDIVSDNNGNLYLTGYMWDSVYFDDHLLVSSSFFQTFITKMNASNGNFIWAVGGGGNGWNRGNNIAVDKRGDIIISGWYRDDLYFSDDSISNGGNNDGPDDIFIAKFDNSGSNIWIKSAKSNLYSNSYDLITNSQNDIYLTGKFRGLLQIESSTFQSTVPNYFDIYVLKLDENGYLQWFRSYGGNSPMNDIGYSLALFNNNVLVTGMYSRNSWFSNSQLSCNGGSDIFVLKLSNTTDSPIINSDTQEEDGDEILIYPNPSSDNLIIKTNSYESVQYQVKILSINGNLIFFDKNYFSNHIEINISALKAGMYLVQIIDLNTKKIVTKKIIKK